MSKRFVVKYPRCYRNAAATNIIQPTHEITLSDPEFVKKLSVDRIVFPKGILFEGEAQLVCVDSHGNNYTMTIMDAAVKSRRFLDIYHAGFELHKWIAAIDALTADTLEVYVDDSKAFIVIKSTYSGGSRPRLHIEGVSEKRNGFSTFLENSLGIPHYPSYLEFPFSAVFCLLDWYDANGGVEEIFMTSDTLASFERKYATEHDKYELNSTIMTIPLPSIKYQPEARLTEFGAYDINRYYNVNDARLYERQIYNVSDMLTPFTITFDSEVVIKTFDLHFYADIGGRGIFEVYFPTDVGMVINTESSEAIEKEEQIERLPYEENMRLV